MIVTMFPEPREQAKAIGVYSFVASAGGSVGLLAGGVLTQGINWHWIFFVNIPIGIATAVLALRLLDKDKGIGFGRGADVLGAVLITGALMLLVYTIVSRPPTTAGDRAALWHGRGIARCWSPSLRGRRRPAIRSYRRIFRFAQRFGATRFRPCSWPAVRLFFLGALYYTSARVRRARDRAGVLPVTSSSDPVAALRRAADHALGARARCCPARVIAAGSAVHQCG